MEEKILTVLVYGEEHNDEVWEEAIRFHHTDPQHIRLYNRPLFGQPNPCDVVVTAAKHIRDEYVSIGVPVRFVRVGKNAGTEVVDPSKKKTRKKKDDEPVVSDIGREAD